MKREIKLKEVAIVGSGAGFPTTYQGASDGDYPFLKVSDMNLAGNERGISRWNNTICEDVRRILRATAFPVGSIIFPKIGAAIATNKKRILTRPSCVDNNVMAVIPNPAVLDSEYLFYLFRNKNITDFASPSNPPSIRKSTVEDWQFTLPTIPDQRRVVDILSRAESIIVLRREAEKKAAELIPALFLDMFGDPATNPKGWPTAAVAQLCSVQTGATPSRDNPLYYGGNIPWVKTGELANRFVDRSEEAITELAVRETNCKIFPESTILVAMYGQGQTRGRCAMLKIPAATNQACAAILPSPSIRAEFLLALLSTQYERLRAMARGGNQANLNLTMIKTFEVLVPPMQREAQFCDALGSIGSIRSQQQAALVKATDAFDALLSRTFAAPADAVS